MPPKGFFIGNLTQPLMSNSAGLITQALPCWANHPAASNGLNQRQAYSRLQCYAQMINPAVLAPDDKAQRVMPGTEG